MFLVVALYVPIILELDWQEFQRRALNAWTPLPGDNRGFCGLVYRNDTSRPLMDSNAKRKSQISVFAYNGVAFPHVSSLPGECRELASPGAEVSQYAQGCSKWCSESMGSVFDHLECWYADEFYNIAGGAFKACASAQIATIAESFEQIEGIMAGIAYMFVGTLISFGFSCYSSHCSKPTPAEEIFVYAYEDLPSQTACDAFPTKRWMFLLPITDDAMGAKMDVVKRTCTCLMGIVFNMLSLLVLLKQGRGLPALLALFFLFGFNASFNCDTITAIRRMWEWGFVDLSIYEMEAMSLSGVAFGLAWKVYSIFESRAMSASDILIISVFGVGWKIAMAMPDCSLAARMVFKLRNPSSGRLPGLAEPLAEPLAEQPLPPNQIGYYCLLNAKKNVRVSLLEKLLEAAFPAFLAAAVGAPHVFGTFSNWRIQACVFMTSYLTSVVTCTWAAVRADDGPLLGGSCSGFFALLTWPVVCGIGVLSDKAVFVIRVITSGEIDRLYASGQGGEADGAGAKKRAVSRGRSFLRSTTFSSVSRPGILTAFWYLSLCMVLSSLILNIFVALFLHLQGSLAEVRRPSSVLFFFQIFMIVAALIGTSVGIHNFQLAGLGAVKESRGVQHRDVRKAVVAVASGVLLYMLAFLYVVSFIVLCGIVAIMFVMWNLGCLKYDGEDWDLDFGNFDFDMGDWGDWGDADW